MYVLDDEFLVKVLSIVKTLKKFYKDYLIWVSIIFFCLLYSGKLYLLVQNLLHCINILQS